MRKTLSIMSILLVNSEEQRFRALWRILFQIVLMLVLVALPIVGITESATWLFKSGWIQCSPELFDKVMDIIVGIVMSCLILFSIVVAARHLDHRKFTDFGFRLNVSWWKQYVLGIALGALLMALIFGIEFFAGWVDIIGYLHVSTVSVPLWLAFLYPIIKAACVSVYEEAISRGYHITNLKEGLFGICGLDEQRAVVLAVILSSAFFGALHLRNPNANMLSTFNLVINGGLFATAYIVTGQLAMPMGLHLAWNLTQGWVFGFSVSGDSEVSSLIHIRQHGQDWIIGGAFGPEGGLLGLVASIAGITLLICMRHVLHRTR